jgi:hypothetical protein
MTTDTAQHFDAIALHIVKDEIDASLNQVENALSAYIEDNSNTFGLNEAAEGMTQINGILQLLEISGAIELAYAMSQLMNRIASQPQDTTDQILGAMSEGLVLLSRYLEFVLLRESLLPHFLLPTINKIHTQLGLPLLREGHFLKPYLAIVQMPALSQDQQALDISAVELERLTSLYRASLNHLLKAKANNLDFQAFKLIGHLARQISSNTPSALYWRAVDSALIQLEDCKLTDTRLRILIQIERNLAQLTANNTDFMVGIDEMADILSLGACRDHEIADDLRQQLGLTDYLMSDLQANMLARYLFGPDSNTIHITTELFQQEISEIKNKVDSLQHGDLIEGGFESIANQLYQLAQGMTLLNLEDAGQLLKQQSYKVAGWQNVSNLVQINELMDTLLFASNAIAILDRSYMPHGSKLPFNNTHISMHQLQEANQVVIKECRDALNMSMRALTTYIEDGDLLHMNNVPAMFDTIAGALLFLNAQAGHDILRQTAKYIEKAFSPENTQPTEQHIALLANVMMSVDHYLEGLEIQKPVGIRPFDIGLDSAAQLQAA